MIVTTYNVWRGLRKEIKLHHVNEPVTSQLLLCMAQFGKAEFLVVKENYADADIRQSSYYNNHSTKFGEVLQWSGLHQVE